MQADIKEILIPTDESAWLNAFAELFIRYVDNKKRHQRIGGSDINALFSKPGSFALRNLWLEKTGKVEAKDISHLEAIQRGIKLEPIIRKKIEAKFNCRFDPIYLEHPEDNFLSGNLDGFDPIGLVVLEIKTMGLNQYFKFLENPKPSKAHLLQIQHYLGLVLANHKPHFDLNHLLANLKAYYVVYNHDADSETILTIAPDLGLIREIEQKAIAFWQDKVLAFKE